VRADLLIQIGRYDDARAELTRAIALTGNQAEHDLLQARLTALATTEPARH
jgi:predicted RNA polymerase sigma factor